MIEELWRGATKTQRLRAGMAAGLVVWAAGLVADMHYLRARPEFREKFPRAAAGEQPGVGLFGSGSSSQPLVVVEEQEEEEWRRARREREAGAAPLSGGGGEGGGGGDGGGGGRRAGV